MAILVKTFPTEKLSCWLGENHESSAIQGPLSVFQISKKIFDTTFSHLLLLQLIQFHYRLIPIRDGLRRKKRQIIHILWISVLPPPLNQIGRS